jgi:5-methylcytosine-specific restriction endonuclease McrA
MKMPKLLFNVFFHIFDPTKYRDDNEYLKKCINKIQKKIINKKEKHQKDSTDVEMKEYYVKEYFCQFEKYNNEDEEDEEEEDDEVVESEKKIRDTLWINNFGYSDVGSCFVCEKTIFNESNGWHAGHLKARAKGGKYTLENLRPYCENCNKKQSTMHAAEFILRNFPLRYEELKKKGEI